VRRKAFSIILLAGLIGSLLWGGTALADRASGAIVWGRCSDPSFQGFHAQCGFLSVPLDYSRPHGKQIEIAVSRIRHTSNAAHYQGVILTNPGGPGGPGLNDATGLIPALEGEGYKAAAADYDWIGFDPRGVGTSKPALNCGSNYVGPDRPSYTPSTSALTRFWLDKSAAYAKACSHASPLQSELLRHMTTRDIAMDMDRIRQSLGQRQITYYGFSWGTYLGQVYSTMFPTQVRRLILDSNVNPTRPNYDTINLDQDRPFERNIDRFFGWVAKHNDVYQLGTTESAVEQQFFSVESQLASKPVDGVVGPDEWTDIFLTAGYSEMLWPRHGQVLSDWVHKHDAATAAELKMIYNGVDDPGDDNGPAAFYATACTDSPWPRNWHRWDRDISAVAKTAPIVAWANGWTDAPCMFWPVPASPLFKVNGNRVSSALLIDETLDAATPFSGDLVVRRLFPHSVLLAEPGGIGHAESLSGEMCVDRTIAAYLTTGALPHRKSGRGPDKTCAPLPEPAPSTSSALDLDSARLLTP
jgi:pimeloyl-ACP methyl ester carboxylesterase